MAIHAPGARLRIAVPLSFVGASRGKHARARMPGSGMNLTPFVDLLVLLVVFFLPQFHPSGELPCACKDRVRLPVAARWSDLEAAPVVRVAGDNITLDGRLVLAIDLDEVDAPPPDPRLVRVPIAALHDQLVTLKNNFRLLHPNNDAFLGMVNLQIDRRVDFQLVKRVMYTCRLAGYDNLNFAVQHAE